MNRATYADLLRTARRDLQAAVEAAEAELRLAVERANGQKEAARSRYHIRLEELADLWLQSADNDADAGPAPEPGAPAPVLLPAAEPVATAAQPSPEPRPAEQTDAVTVESEQPESVSGDTPGGSGERHYSDEEVLRVSLELLERQPEITFIDSFNEWHNRHSERPINRSTYSGIMQRLGKTGKLAIAVPGGRRKPTRFRAPEAGAIGGGE